MIENAIGIFDSGVGGLTVMREIIHRLPNERLIYFGDTGRLPYGNKSPTTIERYSLENGNFLLQKGIKALVVACNTSSALALPALREKIGVPIIDVILPGVLEAVAQTKNKKIGILGTKATIRSGAPQKMIRDLCPEAMLFPIACPLLVHLVEEQWIDHPTVPLIVREYIHPLREQEIDTLLLACTHYPFLRKAIQNQVGEKVTLIDPAKACADQLALLLQANKLLSPELQGEHEYYVSDDPDKFEALATYLFGSSAEGLQAKLQILHSFEVMQPI